jgi:hypothetical protein
MSRHNPKGKKRKPSTKNKEKNPMQIRFMAMK